MANQSNNGGFLDQPNNPPPVQQPPAQRPQVDLYNIPEGGAQRVLQMWQRLIPRLIDLDEMASPISEEMEEIHSIRDQTIEVRADPSSSYNRNIPVGIDNQIKQLLVEFSANAPVVKDTDKLRRDREFFQQRNNDRALRQGRPQRR